MKKRNLLLIGIIQILLLTGSLSAETDCSNGKCFINIEELIEEKNNVSIIEIVFVDNTEYILGEPITKEMYEKKETSIVASYNEFKLTEVDIFESYILREKRIEKNSFFDPKYFCKIDN